MGPGMDVQEYGIKFRRSSAISLRLVSLSCFWCCHFAQLLVAAIEGFEGCLEFAARQSDPFAHSVVEWMEDWRIRQFAQEEKEKEKEKKKEEKEKEKQKVRRILLVGKLGRAVRRARRHELRRWSKCILGILLM